jgi:hypothetical protein
MGDVAECLADCGRELGRDVGRQSHLLRRRGDDHPVPTQGFEERTQVDLALIVGFGRRSRDQRAQRDLLLSRELRQLTELTACARSASRDQREHLQDRVVDLPGEAFPFRDRSLAPRSRSHRSLRSQREVDEIAADQTGEQQQYHAVERLLGELTALDDVGGGDHDSSDAAPAPTAGDSACQYGAGRPRGRQRRCAMVDPAGGLHGECREDRARGDRHVEGEQPP